MKKLFATHFRSKALVNPVRPCSEPGAPPSPSGWSFSTVLWGPCRLDLQGKTVQILPSTPGGAFTGGRGSDGDDNDGASFRSTSPSRRGESLRLNRGHSWSLNRKVMAFIGGKAPPSIGGKHPSTGGKAPGDGSATENESLMSGDDGVRLARDCHVITMGLPCDCHVIAT